VFYSTLPGCLLRIGILPLEFYIHFAPVMSNLCNLFARVHNWLGSIIMLMLVDTWTFIAVEAEVSRLFHVAKKEIIKMETKNRPVESSSLIAYYEVGCFYFAFGKFKVRC
jgi:hypothetical protein